MKICANGADKFDRRDRLDSDAAVGQRNEVLGHDARGEGIDARALKRVGKGDEVGKVIKLPSFSEELCLVPKSVWRRERD